MRRIPVAVCALLLASLASAQPAATPASAPAPVAGARPALKVASAPRQARTVIAPTRPLWSELQPGQQRALAPLAAQWDTLSEAQRRKWIALSQNFPRLSAEEQGKLHSRMSEWVSLSPQQRTQARLNFGEAQKIPADDKKAKWEAYQALTPEQKKQLAASAAKPPSTAAAVKPVPKEKLATVPKAQRPDAKSPRIAASPGQVDHNTLLPQPAQPPGGTTN